MKVLFVTSWYPTEKQPYFGVFVREHARAVRAAGVEIQVLSVVCERSADMLRIETSEFVDDSGIPTYRILIRSRFRDVMHHWTGFQKRLAYRVFLQRIKPGFVPDVIHSNVVFPAGIIGDYLASRDNTPHVLTEHWSKLAGILRLPVISSRVKAVYRRAEVIMPVSFFLKKNIQLLIKGLDERKFTVVPNVVDAAQFPYLPKMAGENTVRFCAVATWTSKKVPDKYPELFIEALSVVQKTEKRKIELVMIGGGDNVEMLKNLCNARGLKAAFKGALPKAEIARELHRSDFLIHASRVETFGVVIVEALMTGTPVICSNAGALGELIDSSNGVLCENNPESWIAGIRKALDKRFDGAVVSAGLKEKYSYESIGASLLRIYESVVKM